MSIKHMSKSIINTTWPKNIEASETAAYSHFLERSVIPLLFS